MKKLSLVLCVAFFAATTMLNAQTTIEELKSMKADKAAAAKALLSEVADIDKQINEFPGWQIGGVGVIGFDLNSNSNWFALNLPNATSNGYGLSAGIFANNNKEKSFWRNSLSFNLKKSNTVLDASLDEDQQTKVSTLTDALDLTSLYGYKLSDKWAISAEGKYISTLFNFNNPGQLTLSAGATWTPINNLVVVIHPIGYQLNFPGDFVSAPGAKIGASYAANIIPNVSWSSNLSLFLPYSSGEGKLIAFEEADDSSTIDPKYTSVSTGTEALLDYSTGDLMNWTWINTFSTKIFNGIGVGLNVGLRSDKQIANQAQYNASRGTFDPATGDNPLQMYYALGLSYTL